MQAYRAAVIGCGRPGLTPGVAEGYAIAYAHAAGYQAAGNVTIVAAADIDQENLDAFATTFDVAGRYHDYREMLEREKPDLVSVCTWPKLHPQMVMDAANAGAKGILCEKPMALGLGEADRMLAACERSGTVLSINHQRRLSRPYTLAHDWLQRGVIGQLIRIEASIGGGWDLLSWGTHWVDMFFYFANDADARWVFAAIDCTRRQQRYNHPVEDRGLTMVGFDAGVTGLLHIAPEASRTGITLIGSEGQLEMDDSMSIPRLIAKVATPPAAHEELPWTHGVALAVRDLIDALETGRAPELQGVRGRKATEVIMAAYASGMLRQMITLPYRDPGFPLLRWFADPVEDARPNG